MKFLILAILAASCFGLYPVRADEAVYDFEKIDTTDGRRFTGIEVLDADEHGLMFRHSKGIAKLDYRQLPTNLRMLYQPLGEVGEAVREELDIPDAPAWEGKSATDAAASLELAAPEWFLTITFIHRAPVCGTMATPCWSCLHHPWFEHALVHPAFREWAVRDFLHFNELW